MESAELFVSAASIWEIGIKAALGKLEADPAEIRASLGEAGLEALPVLGIHAAVVLVLATPVKTGLPGCVKPGPFLPFAEFSIEVFDALHALGWERYAGHVPSQARIAAESFPTAAWKSLGLPPLPAKAKCKGSVVRDAARLPVSERGVAFGADPNHDQLQAVVSGLAAIALVQGNFDAISVVGESPTYKDGCWREGFILNPL
jgi:hypothetical protein